jgi:hypothetical protein
MKLGRIAAIVLAVATVGLLTGGALAMVAVAPVPSSPPLVPSVSYAIPPTTSPNELAMFEPFAGVVFGVGLIQIHLVNYNAMPETYLLRGTTLTVTVPAGLSITVLTVVHQSGQYDWVTQFPTVGLHGSVVVGVLDVETPT